MIRFISIFLLLNFSTFASFEGVIELINKQEKVLRLTSNEFSSLLKEVEGLKEEELTKLLKLNLTKSQTKNLLAAMSRMGSNKTVFKLLFEQALKADDKQKLYCYFAYIVYEPAFLEDIKDPLSSLTDIKPFLSFLGSKTSSEAFSLILEQHNFKNNYSRELLNTVTEKNIKELIPLLKNKISPGKQLAEKILSLEADSYDEDTLIFMLNGKQKTKKVEYSQEEIAALKELYQALNKEDFNSIASRILSGEFSVELNHKVRSQVDLNNNLVKKVFQAKALNFNYEVYGKYEEYISPLNSSNIKTRLQTLLKLRDFSDPDLAPTYIHLLDDPSADVRRDALDCLSNILDKNNSVMSKYLPVNNNKSIKHQMLMNGEQVGQSTSDAENESQTENINKIIHLLRDPNPPVVVSAIELLTFLSVETANKQIIYLLKSSNSQILISAIASVEKTEPKGALLNLISLLHHQDWKVRARAAKAIDEFDDKGEFLPRLETMFFEEKDPFVKGHIFNFLKESENPKVFTFLKQKAKEAKSPEEKYDNMTKLLSLKNIPAQEVELLRSEFHKFSNSTFCEKWLSVAGEKKLDIEKELILALQRGHLENKKSALMVAGRRGIDASPYLSKKAYYEIGYGYIFYYMRENKLLDIKPKLEMLKYIFLDPNFPEYNNALVSLKNRLSDDLNLNDSEKEMVKDLLKKAREKAPETSQIIISLILGEKLPNSTIDSLMKTYKEAEDKSSLIPVISTIAETVTEEQVKKYEDQFTELLMSSELRPYAFNSTLKHFSLKNLKKLFNSSTSYQDDYLEAMAPQIPFKEMLELSENLFGSKYVSDYEIFGAYKLSIKTMKSDDTIPFLKQLSKSKRQGYWEISDLFRLIPVKIRAEAKKLVLQEKLEPSTMVFLLVANSLSEKDFELFYKLTSHIKIDTKIFSYGQGDVSFDHFYNSTKSKIENSKVDLKLLQFYENINSLSSSGNGFSRSIDGSVFEKKIAEIDKKYRGRVFQILENSGRKSQAFYELYLSLIQNEVDPIIYKKTFSPERNNYIYSRNSIQAPRSAGNSVLGTLKKMFTKKTDPNDVKQKIIERLLELKDKTKGSQLEAVAIRLSKLLSTEQYVDAFHKMLKTQPSLADFIPPGVISKTTFQLIRDNVNLSLIKEYTANNIGLNLDPVIVKDLIAEYRKDKTAELWPYILNKLGPEETDLVLSSLKEKFKVLKQNVLKSGNNTVRRQFSALAQKLRQPMISSKLKKHISATAEEIETVYMLTLLNIKLPSETLLNLLKVKNLNDEQKLQLINTFYINKTYASEIFKLHENYLVNLKGKILAEAIKLSPKFHDGNTDDDNSFLDSNNLSIRKVLSYSGVSSYYYNEESKAVKIPDSAKEAYSSLNNKKLQLYKSANDPSLFQYVLDKNNLTLKVVNQYLANGAEELDGPLIENLNDQFKKASIEDIEVFLNHILQKSIYLNLDEPQIIGQGLDDKKLAYLKKVHKETKSDNIKTLLQPVYINSVKTDEDFDELVKNLLKDETGAIYTNIRSMSSVKEKLSAAIFRYLKNYESTEKISNQNLLFALGALELENDGLKLLDTYIPKFAPEFQKNFIRLILKDGPYHPNALKVLLDSLDKPNQNILYADLSYLFYKKTLDEKKLAPVKEIFDQIQVKKLKIYQSSTNQALKGLLLLVHQDVELIKKEMDQALQKNTVKAYDVYILHRFSTEDQEKYAKLLWEKFKGSDQAYYIQNYLSEKGYSWLPKMSEEDSF